MSQGLEAGVRDLVLSNGSFGPQEIVRITDAVTDDYSQLAVLRDSVAELEMSGELSPAMAVRLGVCQYLLGRYETAIGTLSHSDGGALAQMYIAKAKFALGRYDEAVKGYEAAKAAGYNADECALAMAEAKRYARDPEGALAVLDKLSGAVEQSAEYLYQRAATVASLGGNPAEVVALYERAVASNDRHPGALFGLAMENDRRGNDDRALEYYQRAAQQFPSHVGALLNLGILCEDRQLYDRAQQSYLRILDTYPGHPRASLFLKDARASGDMYYDEEAQKKRDRLAQVLNIPVTDFELSVRSRNCLQKMNIHTLGDLARVSEQELLASKNFGETSLVEIREMLVSRGLSLGQLAFDKGEPETQIDTSTMSPDEQALLERPIADLNLSVRARKCMVRLGLNTIGELLRRTGDDLLECKNFGVTSLNEVREKLTQYGIKLRGD